MQILCLGIVLVDHLGVLVGASLTRRLNALRHFFMLRSLRITIITNSICSCIFSILFYLIEAVAVVGIF